MNKSLSIYFDAIRFLASVLVVHAHLIQYHFISKQSLLGSFEFGREAVIIFFVLSGYVIAYSSQEKHKGLKDYCVSRAARIYSIAIPALFLAYAIGVVGYVADYSQYTDFYQLDKLYVYIVLHLAFLGETLQFYEKPYLLVPYWSLSYEVWYYIFFGVLFFLKGIKKYCLLLLVLVVFGHRILLLLPVWYSGVVLYKLFDKVKFSQFVSAAGLILTLVLIILFKSSGLPDFLRQAAIELWPSYMPKLGSAERVFSDYIYCLLISVNFLFAKSVDFSFLTKNEKLIRKLSYYTFSLYLTHMLVIEPMTRSFTMYEEYSLLNLGLCVVLVTLLTYLVGEVGRRFYKSIQQYGNKALKLDEHK